MIHSNEDLNAVYDEIAMEIVKTILMVIGALNFVSVLMMVVWIIYTYFFKNRNVRD